MKLNLPAALFLGLIFAGTVARADTYYVSYYANNTIEEFAPDGTDLGQFPATGLNGPEGMAFDSHGNLYVASSGNNSIEEYSPTGTHLATFGTTLNDPVALVFDAAGNFYTCSFSGGTIEKFSPTGVDLGVFARSDSPWGLLFDSSGNLCVTDKIGGSVQRFSSTGVSLGTFVSLNINQPTGMAFDSTGNLYVCNQSPANTVQIYSPAGVNLGQVAVTGLNQPTGLLFDSGDNLFICDGNNNRIRKVSPTGQDLGDFATTGSGIPVFMIARAGLVAPMITNQPAGFTAHSNGTATFSVAANGANLSYQWQKSGVNLSDGGNVTGSASATLQLASVTAIDVAQYRVIVSNSGGTVISASAFLDVVSPLLAVAGAYYVSYFATNVIEEFSSTGVDLGPFIAAGLNQPQGLAFDRQGNLYVANSGNNSIEKYSPSGIHLATLPKGGLNDPVALIFDRAGNLYASNYASSTVERFSPAGVDLGVFARSNNPWGLAFDFAGHLWVSNKDKNTIQRFSSTGVDMGIFGSANLSAPSAIVFDSSGDFFIGNQGSNTIQEFAPNGGSRGQVAVPNLDSPTGLLFDKDGNLLINDSLNNQIRKVSHAGKDLGVFATTGSGVPVFTVPQPAFLQPNVTRPPASVTVVDGGSATFTVNAGGFPAPIFQWQISTDGGVTWRNLTEGGNFSGTTNSSLVVSDTMVAQSGNQFRVLAINVAGAVSSKAATLTIDSPASVTSLSAASGNLTINNSGNLTVSANSSVTFSVAATGNALKYQWQLNGKNISGATKATYTIAKAGVASDGNYTVIVSNPLNLKPAAVGPFLLTVLTPPVIVTPLKATLVKVGTGTTFKVVASGNPLPSFTWYFGNSGLPTGSNLTTTTNNNTATSILGFKSVTSADTGIYKVVITNGQPPVPPPLPLSSSAKLTVIK